LKEIFTSKSIKINNLNYGKGEALYFIGTEFEGKRENIWMINQNKELIQITDSDTEKDDLDVQ